MKKLFVIFLASLFSSFIFAGGLVTNLDQSAMFTRFQCRDATLDIDAAFYNPAGLVHMNDGFYLSLNNNTMGQLKMITTEYENLTDGQQDFKGKVALPVFPALYGVYKNGRFAFSFAVNPIGGDGKTKYSEGLPSSELYMSDAVKVVRNTLELVNDLVVAAIDEDRNYDNITGYDLELSTESKHLIMGYQANMAFQINPYISVAAGARVVHANKWIRSEVTDYFVVGNNIYGTFKVNPADYSRLLSFVLDSIATIPLNELADEVESREQDIETDVSMSGLGITPVLSINYAPSLTTNLSLKYEFRTKLDILTRVNNGKDGIGQTYKDGSAVIADIPAMLSIGITRIPTNRLMFYAGIHYYFDKPIDFDGYKDINIEMIEKNSYEFGFGGEYKINSKYRISSGVLLTRPGVNAEYQSETRYAIPSNTIGAGIGLRLTSLIDLNIGGSYTLYKKTEASYDYITDDGAATSVNVSQYYDTRTWIFSVGIDFLFGEQ